MTAALAVLAAGLALALALTIVNQRRTARRLLDAGHALMPDVVATGDGLAEATSLVERAIDRAVVRDDSGSLASSRLAQALGNLPQGVVVHDEAGATVFRNDVAAGYLTGRASEALVEEAIMDLAHVAASGGDGVSRIVELSGPPERILSLSAWPLHKARRHIGALVVIEDISERRHLEAMRRDFVANVSHELKTPVGALSLLAETISAEEEPAVVRRLTDRMVSEAGRVARMIDDLLELSSIESAGAAASAEHGELAASEVVEDALERVAHAADRRSITFDVEVEGTGESTPVLSGDRRQLVSAIQNLLENAVKYSDPGSSVSVRVRSDEGCVEIAVHDEGIGIPPRDLERVFERFYRVDRARSRETGGTGLGLAIVRNAVHNHGGEVRVDSREGEGSTFTLRFPRLGQTGPGPATAG